VTLKALTGHPSYLNILKMDLQILVKNLQNNGMDLETTAVLIGVPTSRT